MNNNIKPEKEENNKNPESKNFENVNSLCGESNLEYELNNNNSEEEKKKMS